LQISACKGRKTARKPILLAGIRPERQEFMPRSDGSNRPDVSIIIPVMDKLALTRACLASLDAAPCAASWELLVIDNGSTDGSGAWLADEERAGRLTLLSPGENLGFAAACNAGADRARGRHLMFLNNDTEVTPGWLDPLVTTLDRDPRVWAAGSKLLYPDGTIQHGGVALVEAERGPLTLLEGIHLAHHKPADFPGAARAQRLQACSAACLLVRADVFADLDGFDTAYWNGNEDVDLCLRLGEAGGRIVYRPESVVVHHESQSGPERWAKVSENVKLLNERWRGRAVPDFRRAADGTITAGPAGRIALYTAPVARLAPDPAPDTVSVVVLTWNALEYTRLCAESLLRHTDPRHELLFVDNGSEQDTLDYLAALERDHSRVTVVRNGANLGFAGGNNVGLAAARCEHVCLLNSDTVVTEGWLERLLAPLADPAVGLVGPVTNSITGDQKLPAVGYDERTLAGLADFAHRIAGEQRGNLSPALWVVGFCVLLRRGLVERIGGLDEGFGQGNYEDTDYCLRAFLAGWRAVVARDCFIHHFGSRSFVAGRVDYARQIDAKWRVFRRKWNLPPEARQDGRIDLERLVREGFAPVLHAEPLPPGGRAVNLPLPAWEAARWLDHAEALFALGRLEEAGKALRAILRDHPDHTRAASDLACVLWQGDPEHGLEEAVGLLETVLEREPGNADARHNLTEMRATACGLP
jgi:GT2 family glycosyltransferase